MSLESAQKWVRWIDQDSQADHRQTLAAFGTTEDRLKYAKDLGYDFTLEEHEQAYLDYASETIELGDEELAAAAGGFVAGITGGFANVPNFVEQWKQQGIKAPAHAVYAVFPSPL